MIDYWVESWKRTPRPIRRLWWWWLLPFAWMGAILAVNIYFWGRGPRWFQWVNPWGMFAGQFIAIGFTTYMLRGVRRAFNASGGRLCTRCGHSLAGLGDVGRCPECGESFHTEMDRLAWKESGVELTKRA